MIIATCAKKRFLSDTNMLVRLSLFIVTAIACRTQAGVGGGIDVQSSVNVASLLISSLIFLAIMAIVFGVTLAITAKKFHVKTDPRIDEITSALAHAHCGACGFAGCEQYAEALLNDPAVEPNLCTPGGKACAETIARLSGKNVSYRQPEYARIMCQGSTDKITRKFSYTGVRNCQAAVLAAQGDKTCPYGCLGYGSCVRACPFGALSMGANGLPIVNIDKCTGCKKCATACPRNVIEILPVSATVVVACHSKDKGGATRNYCTIGCIGCGKCVKVCPVEPVKAIKVANNLAHIDNDLCIGCGMCVKNCPVDAIVSNVTIADETVDGNDDNLFAEAANIGEVVHS